MRMDRGRSVVKPCAVAKSSGPAISAEALIDPSVSPLRVARTDVPCPSRQGPLTVSVGLAVLGEDGHNAAALIDAAEQTRFAADASGTGIITDHAVDGGFESPMQGPTLVS